MADKAPGEAAEDENRGGAAPAGLPSFDCSLVVIRERLVPNALYGCSWFEPIENPQK